VEKIIQKKHIYKIYLTTLAIFLVLPFFLYLNQSSNNFECLQGAQKTEELTYVTEVEVEYVSISIFPEYKNILCLGKIIHLEMDDNEVSLIKRAYSDQLFTFGLDIILGLFFIASFFRQYFESYYIKFQVSQFIYFFLYIYFILNKFGYYAYNIPKYDPGYILFFIFLLNLKVNKDDTIGLLSQFIFFALFGTKYFGLTALVLIITNKNLVVDKFMKYKLFLYLPVIKFSLIFVSSIFEKLNILWLSLIENPHSGYTRFFDLQWNLVSLICEKNPDFSSKTNFAGERFCPSELYSPIYQYLSFKFNIYFAYLLLMGALLTILSIIYLRILENEGSENYLLVLLLLSPTLNYQIHQGNLDFLTFVLISSLMIWKIPYLLKLFVIAFLGLLELHPLPFLLGMATYNAFKKNIKKFTINILVILTAGTVIWTDNSLISVKNWNSSIGFSYIYHPEISFGLSTDHILLLGKKIEPLFLYPTFLLIYLSLILIFRKKVFIKKFPSQYISNEEFLGFTAWFALIILYENFSYRLAIFSFIFYFIFVDNKKFIQILLMMAIFLTPTSLIEFEIIRMTILFVNKISLYIVAFFIFHKAFQILFIDSNDLDSEKFSK
tara:strand:- start:1316 stop:3139 length:1824 start_codon:yes stop_codon:yes gene_type:complete